MSSVHTAWFDAPPLAKQGTGNNPLPPSPEFIAPPPARLQDVSALNGHPGHPPAWSIAPPPLPPLPDFQHQYNRPQFAQGPPSGVPQHMFAPQPMMPPVNWMPQGAMPLSHGFMPLPSGMVPSHPPAEYGAPAPPYFVGMPPPAPTFNFAPPPQSFAAPSGNPPPDTSGPRQLMITFLDTEVTNAELHNAFCVIGELEAVRVIYDKVTGRSKCFGFVYFKHARDAATAMQCMSGHPIRGKRIKVIYANPQRPAPPEDA